MSKPFDLMEAFGRFGAEHRLSLRDPTAKEAFGLNVGEAVDRILSDPAFMHGKRAEAMFEALLVSLGEFRLLKAEDSGHVFPDDRFVAPDFRVVLNDGSHWLIEVKNVYEPEPFRQSRCLMNRDYHGKLAAYAAATGAELKLAVFWARWSLWTLVSPDRLIDDAGDLMLDMGTAVTVNELGRLGDRTIGTRAPLRLRFTMDPERTSRIGSDGQVNAVIQGWSLLSEDREVLDPVEREIVLIFIQHGEWRGTPPTPIVEGNRLLAVEFTWAPENPSDQGFDFVGTLSRMFARYFAACTIEDGAVIQVKVPHRPGWFVPLIRSNHRSTVLPLWRFILEPNFRGAAMKA